MSSTFVENTWMAVEHCCNCSMMFAMPLDFQKRRVNDHKIFHCPAGHSQHYTGPTEAQQLKEALERNEQMLSAASARADKAETNLGQVTKAHRKMRQRVMNGVCPCCNRSFQNLREHMKTEHADFDSVRTLFALRSAFGMSQAAVASEAGVEAQHVSLYERGRQVASRAKTRLDSWLETHGAGEPA